jgi:hypothetical protein
MGNSIRLQSRKIMVTAVEQGVEVNKEIEASCIENIAVHPSMGQKARDRRKRGTNYTVTHIPTGLAILSRLPNRELARDLAITLAPRLPNALELTKEQENTLTSTVRVWLRLHMLNFDDVR